MSEIKCSVIIPAYNAADHIADSLESIVGQVADFDFEVLVIDDGSKDETVQLVSDRFPQVRLFEKENGGPGSARNFGARQAVSDILVFNDADDRMVEGRIQHQVGYMLEHPEVKLTFGNHQHGVESSANYIINQNWGSTGKFAVVENAFNRLLARRNSIACTTVALRKEAYLEIGGQPEEHFVAEDYAMNCAIAKRWPIAATTRDLTRVCQHRTGNLMSSVHTYEGPPKVLYTNLKESSELLSPEDMKAACGRLRQMVTMLVRHKWMMKGRATALKDLKRYADFLPAGYVLQWELLTLIPPAVPRFLRHLKHRGQVTHSNG